MMKVDLLPVTITLVLGLWKTSHMLLFGWGKRQFYPEEGLSGWHFLTQWLCSLLMSDLLMLGETSKIVLPQGFNCSLPSSVRYAGWFIIIQIDSLPLSAWLLSPASRPPRRSTMDQRRREITWSNSDLFPGQPAACRTGTAHKGELGHPIYAQVPEWVTVPMCVRGEEVAARTRKGNTAPLRSTEGDSLHPHVLFGQIPSQRQVRLIS